ncbi:MAG: hypothetical protein LBL43_03355 [Treponema sp.]|jgi:hypothetical protein|nr:hypothetical protein [Treponema sp.]
MNIKISLFLLFFPLFALWGGPLYSPTWGFRIDLPEDYEYAGGDGADRFSFRNAGGAALDMVVYGPGKDGVNPHKTVDELARSVNKQLGGRGEISFFDYRYKRTALMELRFADPGQSGKAAMAGWGLCLELGGGETKTAAPGRAFLVALAYGPAEKADLQILHFSALDSIAPSVGDRRSPGPITEFSYPRQTPQKVPVPGADSDAWIYGEDAEAAQALVDREFAVLRRYQASPRWKEAWTRFYRAVYRDSFERLADIAFVLERKWNVNGPGLPDTDNRELAGRVLRWVQSFKYERDLLGSDFVNLVSAALERRGDCDSRALLWAVVLNHAAIEAALMVSREYSHAMGLAILEGPGAHFELQGRQWLVAETTASVDIGLIGKEVSEISRWLGIIFE